MFWFPLRTWTLVPLVMLSTLMLNRLKTSMRNSNARRSSFSGENRFIRLESSVLPLDDVADGGDRDRDARRDYLLFQTLNRATLDLYVPFLHSAFTENDYSIYLGSHKLIRDIADSASETCRTLDVDQKLNELMSEYHQRAMGDPKIAAESYHSVYKVIDRSSA
jgi:hypothetical protein